ncbi:MAG: glutamine-hydrolyzing carbamoyl-phosphate synthase small subunit [Oscillospiraceae bacterium]|nr:glutamine-hydrolyzing carbamoyl-phosphate synthase small subunit [Oscillospiraceae bacterium]
MKKRYLILEDGTIFQGWAFGADRAVIGELVFNTSVVGYVENMTDPAYCGQILMDTFPMAGNYGIMEEDFDGKPMLSGFVAKEFCAMPSNFRCEYDLDTFLKNHDIPGLCGVDTRELTNRIREYGVVNAMITEKLPEVFEEIAAFTIKDVVAKATCEKTEVYEAAGEQAFHVVMIDYGKQLSLVRAFTSRGCKVTAVPAFTAAEDILALGPDGIVLSGGPGDPAENTACIEIIRALVGKKPIFGMGLGHELLAIAMGGQTRKMKYGHRGGNQPCRDLTGTRTYITSQNHGYEVKADTVPGAVEIFRNVNDGSCEGLDYPGKKAFSVQFHPDGCTVGAKNDNALYARFMTMMKEG